MNSYLKESQNRPIIVTKNGKPIAVLLGLTDEEKIKRLVLAYSPKFQSILDRGRKQIEVETDGILHDTFWKEIEGLKGW